MAPTVYSPTASQQASAVCHLERRSEWSTVRIAGIRYVVVVSGRSNRAHFVRADDAAGCDCVWSQRMPSPCSHRIAVELAALEDNLREPAPVSIRALYPSCAGGCGQITENRDGFCDSCGAIREREQRMAAARAKVLREWTGSE